MKPYTFKSEARLEALDAADYYKDRETGASNRFIDELSRVIIEICEAPQRWPCVRGTNIQRRVLKRFPYIIYYRNDPHAILILTIAHTSRRPGYWKSRIAVD